MGRRRKGRSRNRAPNGRSVTGIRQKSGADRSPPDDEVLEPNNPGGLKKRFVLRKNIYPVEANADVVTFDDNPDNNYWASPITSDGFTFTDLSGQNATGTAESLAGSSATNGTVHLMAWVNNGSLSGVTMENSAGLTFDLYQIDFTSGYLNGNDIATQLTVSGYDGGNNLVASEVFTATNNDYNNTAFSTLSLNNDFRNLSSVTFEAEGKENRTGYDNIFTNPVPESASLTLVGIGLAGLGVYRKKLS